GVGDGGVGRGVAQVDHELFGPFVHRVVEDRDGDRLAGDAGGEAERAAGAGVVGAAQGAAVGGGEVDRGVQRAGVAQRDGEGGRAGPFVDGHVIDAEGRAVVVVAGGGRKIGRAHVPDDGGDVAGANGGADRAGQAQAVRSEE